MRSVTPIATAYSRLISTALRICKEHEGDNLKANIELIDRITRIAEGKGATPAQLALAWVTRRMRADPWNHQGQ